MVVSRGELVEIGGAFRIPEVLAKSGAVLREVGTTNRTHSARLRARHRRAHRAAAQGAPVELPHRRLHRRGRRSTRWSAIGRAARRAGDGGSRQRRAGRSDRATGCRASRWSPSASRRGADLVTFSGDKLLGGPQAGHRGRPTPTLIARLRQNPLRARAALRQADAGGARGDAAPLSHRARSRRRAADAALADPAARRARRRSARPRSHCCGARARAELRDRADRQRGRDRQRRPAHRDAALEGDRHHPPARCRRTPSRRASAPASRRSSDACSDDRFCSTCAASSTRAICFRGRPRWTRWPRRAPRRTLCRLGSVCGHLWIRMHLILGTAGHIDHGKTALIKALTGIDTDRLKEERERGISIDLGFAHFDVGDGEAAGVVDVPGHERFIRNMLAGAHGIDVVLLVVAADDGVMPQTEEHLDILHLLGARRGVVAMTKVDLVEPGAAPRRARGDRDSARRHRPRGRADGRGVGGHRRGPGARCARRIARRRARLRRAPRRRAASACRSTAPSCMRGHGVVVTGTATRRHRAHRRRRCAFCPAATKRACAPCRCTAQAVEDGGVRTARRAQPRPASSTAPSRRGQVVCDPRARPRHRSLRRLGRAAAGGAAPARPPRRSARLRRHRRGDRQDRLARRPRRRWRPRNRRTRSWCCASRSRRSAAIASSCGPKTAAPRSAAASCSIRSRHDRSAASIRDCRRPRGRAHAATPLERLRALLGLDTAFAVTPDALAAAANLRADEVRALLAGEDRRRSRCRMRARRGLHDAARRWQRSCCTADALDALPRIHRKQPRQPGMEMESLRSQLAPDLPPKVFRAVVEQLAGEKVLVRADSVRAAAEPRRRLGRGETRSPSGWWRCLGAAAFTPPESEADRRRAAHRAGAAAPRF